MYQHRFQKKITAETIELLERKFYLFICKFWNSGIIFIDIQYMFHNVCHDCSKILSNVKLEIRLDQQQVMLLSRLILIFVPCPQSSLFTKLWFICKYFYTHTFIISILVLSSQIRCWIVFTIFIHARRIYMSRYWCEVAILIWWLFICQFVMWILI